MIAYMVYELFADGSMDARKFFLKEEKAQRYIEEEQQNSPSHELNYDEIDIEE